MIHPRRLQRRRSHTLGKSHLWGFHAYIYIYIYTYYGTLCVYIYIYIKKNKKCIYIYVYVGIVHECRFHVSIILSLCSHLLILLSYYCIQYAIIIVNCCKLLSFLICMGHDVHATPTIVIDLLECGLFKQKSLGLFGPRILQTTKKDSMIHTGYLLVIYQSY